MKHVLSRIAIAAVAAVNFAAHAEWPERPVRLVVPFSAGGPTDAVARSVAEKMAGTLGQPVVVENRPGADGAIAAQSVAVARADGYTVLFATSSVMSLPRLMDPPPFSQGALLPVASVGRFVFGLFVHPHVRATSVRELVQLLRERPGDLRCATANASETIAAGQFERATGTSMLRVPYKGAAQAMPDLLAGRIDAYITPLNAGLPYARRGQLRLLATLLPQRSALARDVPTLDESGIRGVAVPSQQLLAVPAGTGAPAIAALAAAVESALADTLVRARLTELGLAVESASGAQLASMVRDSDTEYARLSAVGAR
jgi:tripartite-type tricarboxylate transporter receptor subunit TctC